MKSHELNAKAEPTHQNHSVESEDAEGLTPEKIQEAFDRGESVVWSANPHADPSRVARIIKLIRQNKAKNQHEETPFAE